MAGDSAGPRVCEGEGLSVSRHEENRMTQTTSEKLWEIIVTSVNEDTTVREFIRTCREHWKEALHDRMKDDDHTWGQEVKNGEGEEDDR